MERLRKFKSKKPKAKKIIFIEDRYMETVEKIIDIYNKSEDLNKLTQSSEGMQILKKSTMHMS